uniref:Uncharacterized protein n=1 Tax=Arundo donax TaxID=35708 RepID=A0A0A9DAT2_ARUDO
MFYHFFIANITWDPLNPTCELYIFDHSIFNRFINKMTNFTRVTFGQEE